MNNAEITYWPGFTRPPAFQHAVQEIIDFVLDDAGPVKNVYEATVHLPPRGSIWQGTYIGADGRQVWRSTGLTNRDQALWVVRRWEAEARAQRAQMGQQPRRPLIRVRRSSPEEVKTGPFSHREIAIALKISERSVRRIERRAIEKLKRHRALRQIWQQLLSGELDEQALRLTPEEVAALFGLTRTEEERCVVEKILSLIQPE